ncbi:hypothetical protein [Streptomyces bambusae]|uniref:Uncharacterized protein n=1 Tax=Streptomyces bambusae TaxID=1550616 RepID=A0ABS6Z7S0_9ACTN|nr:hypothetical protein [Streptomyces bambusae]MBW5483810.1 hypothetical protein [Streptomyces bambusae]
MRKLREDHITWTRLTIVSFAADLPDLELNPRFWPRDQIRAEFREHLDLTLKEATDRLQGNFAADIRDYDEVHDHILGLADFLSCGVIKRFPDEFRKSAHPRRDAICP